MKLIVHLVYAILLLAFIASCEQKKRSNAELVVMELPHWSLAALEAPAFKNSYDFDTSINPFYLTLDIDGNCSMDMAAVVVEKASGRRGIALLHHESDSALVFGAGNPNTFGGINWNWLVGWKAEERLTAGAKVSAHKGTALILYTETSGANWMYWNGKEWEWVAQ
ncbi:hypothetical protein [uncultured Pontibacter sp.]|uniref:hypothetical protein n=1 Tax=uncultured Pontibacter sp. TaxID=453356 RepID=UPI0026087398|nr:hypothetical protein [uncultured Pontibacter sp.]